MGVVSELKANGKQSGGRFSYNDDKHIVFVSINIEQPQHQFQKNTMLYPGGILDVPLDYGSDKEASIEGFKLALNKKVEVGLWLPSIRARIDLGSWKVTDVMKGDTASVRLLSEKSTNKMLEYKINQYNERLKLVVTMKLQHNSGKVAVQLQYRSVTDQEKKQYQLCRQALTWLQWKQEYKEQSQDGASKKQRKSRDWAARKPLPSCRPLFTFFSTTSSMTMSRPGSGRFRTTSTPYPDLTFRLETMFRIAKPVGQGMYGEVRSYNLGNQRLVLKLQDHISKTSEETAHVEIWDRMTHGRKSCQRYITRPYPSPHPEISIQQNAIPGNIISA